MNEIKDALCVLGVAQSDINSAIKKLEKAEDVAFDVFNIITSAEYGKQRFFKEKEGLIYDRAKNKYLLNFETALNRYVEEISNAE